MIIATITAILVLSGGGGLWFGDEIVSLKKGLKTVLKDSEYREPALEIAADMKSSAKEHTKKAKALSEELNGLLEECDAAEPEVDGLIEAFKADTYEFQRELARQHIKLRGMLTREEWAALYPEPIDEG